MKTLKKAVLFILLIGTVSRLAAQTKHSEEMTVPLSEPGKPVTLEAHLMKGSIKVIGYEGKDVLIQVLMDSSKEEEEDRDDDSRGMKRIGSTGGMDVRADEDNNTVRISSSAENKLAGLVIKVPQNTTRIELGSINGGDITVSDVSGKLELHNVNGRITATGISGSVVANTVNGDVIVKFKSVDASAAMAFSNLNGKIDITLPADTKANLKLKCDRGEMFTDFDIEVDKTRPKVETKNEDHFHQVKIDDWVLGKINGGGSQLELQSQFGSIYIRKAK
jgi:hypothetical protein